MTSTRKFKTTDSAGTSTVYGTEFDDRLSLPYLNTDKITRIVITYDQHLRSITVHYTNVVGVPRGEVTGARVELELREGEFITTVEGTFSDAAISKIAFTTSSGIKWGPFGRLEHANTFEWGKLGPGMGLLYFTGNAGSHLRILRATFATYNCTTRRRSAVQYEKHIDSVPETDPPSVPQSHFATSLMSPIIKLLVGPDPAVVFYASQETLCRLPFFRAALQGGFREASTHEMRMPDDEPHTVAALIEFQYTGRYAYPFRPSSEAVDEEQLPVADLTEGTYHVGVYATAHRYGCTGLEEEARKAFAFVLGELKGIEVLRLWKSAYARELCLAAVKDDEGMSWFGSGLAALVRELVAGHLTEMEQTAVEYPMLMLDLLSLVAASE